MCCGGDIASQHPGWDRFLVFGEVSHLADRLFLRSHEVKVIENPAWWRFMNMIWILDTAKVIQSVNNLT